MNSDMFDGPYGLWGVAMSKGHLKVKGPFACYVTERDSAFSDMRGIVTIRDRNSRIVADAWLSKQPADERALALQWFMDVVSAAYGAEVRIVERRTR